jgi:hypothetical protein
VFSINGGTKRLAVVTSGSGTGPFGNAISRSGNYVVTWNDATSCFGLDGSWATTVANHQWSTQVSALSKCGAQCPAAGGSITHHGGLSNLTIHVDFDGSATADWSTSNGYSGTINLLCQP